MNITLVQPRHVYAPTFEEELLGHIYMPNSLLSFASRLISLGHNITLYDENIEKFNLNNTNIVGVNMIGSPYINSIREIFIKAKIENNNIIPLIGGQGINGFSKNQLKILFGKDILYSDIELNKLLGKLPSPENTSLIPAYNLISDNYFKLYLSTEFSLYLSQGCKYHCSFCAASKAMKESYRDINIVMSDLEYLTKKAISFELDKLTIYLSNLDLFQNPRELLTFVNHLTQLKKKYKRFSFIIRGLATSKSFLDCHKNFPKLIRDFKNNGLEKVGFGIDGATPQVWKAIKKPQNNSQDNINAIIISNQIYGIIPETLMVFGHNNFDTEESLKLAINFVEETHIKYKAIPRPHVAKDIIPGNDGWRNPENKITIDYLIDNPLAFQMLDFTTLPNRITHKDENFANRVTESFLTICNLQNAKTEYTLPEDPMFSKEKLEYNKKFNLRKYDV